MKRTLLVGSLHHERNVVRRTTIAYHADRNVFQGLTCNCLKADIVGSEVTYDTDDAHVFLDGNGAILLQFVHNILEMVAVVYRHADAHLTRADHIDTGLVSLEYLEDLTEETISKEHSAAVYLDADVTISSCNCLNDTTLEVNDENKANADVDASGIVDIEDLKHLLLFLARQIEEL